MNGLKPTLGIEFDDNYKEAKNKLIDFMKALNGLTDVQRCQLAREYMASIGMAASFEQFISYMNNGGQK